MADDDLYNYDAAYTGGALVFRALRLQVGDEAFFEILRTYHERFQHSAGLTELFCIDVTGTSQVPVTWQTNFVKDALATPTLRRFLPGLARCG